jgi:hypothetical protein
VWVSGTVALVSQTPFIVNATLRDNILFGKPMGDGLYYRYPPPPPPPPPPSPPLHTNGNETHTKAHACVVAFA